MDPEVKLMLIGAGPHARRTFLPHVQEIGGRFGASIRAVVDLESSREKIEVSCRERGFRPRFLWVEPFRGGELPVAVRSHLDRLAGEEKIGAVLVSTPPELHKAYAAWALERGLSIFMDKPVTTRPGAVCDPAAAAGIHRDYLELRAAYDRLQKRWETAFVVNAHRRFHPTYLEVVRRIEEVRDRTGHPVTSVYSTHCDGQWRLPAEIAGIEYHGYNQGFGKASHSGYHFFDTGWRFYRAGQVPEKEADSAEIFATLVHPRALLHHLGPADYRRLFGSEAEAFGAAGPEELACRWQGYGEIDVYADAALRRQGEVVGHLSFHLLHNSFSQRAWARPNLEDLYKGNGRVRHELHSLQQGPFQNIQIHSFQSEGGLRSEATAAAYGMAGNNHWDIHVFRNAELIGGERYEKIAIDDLMARSGERLVVEEIKKGGLVEFLAFLAGRLPKSALRSNIDSHELPPALMSGIYLSHIRRRRGEHPIVTFDLASRRFRPETLPSGAEEPARGPDVPTPATSPPPHRGERTMNQSMHEKKPPLHLVYTSGRVGSTTLFGTLKRELGEDQVFKVHRLTPEGLAEYRRFRPIWTDDERVFEMLAGGGRERYRMKMITLTRDPFASEVSSLFHNLEVHFPGEEPNSFDLRMLAERLEAKKSSSSEGYFVRWFDIECAPFTGIDVYARPFPRERGYEIFRRGETELLVLRLEDLDRVFRPALRDFLGLEVEELELHHIGERQPYAPLYRRFKAEVRFSPELLDAYYETKYCRHFYAPEELEAFRARWQAAAPATASAV